MPPHQELLQRPLWESLDRQCTNRIVAVIRQHGAGGLYGVPLFFAIRRFLVPTLLPREKRHIGGIALRNFYARGSLRRSPLDSTVPAPPACLVGPGGPEAARGAQFFANLPAFLPATWDWPVPATAAFARTGAIGGGVAAAAEA